MVSKVDHSKLMPVSEVAIMFGVSKMTVYRLIKLGELPAYKIGRGFRVDRSKAVEYLDRCEVASQD